MCGSCSGSQTCINGSCMDPLMCTPDEREANDTRGAAMQIATMTDAPNSRESFSRFNIHTDGDEDWFAIPVDDNPDFGSPRIETTLSGVPEGGLYSLSTYYDCPTGEDLSLCTQGMSTAGNGCSTAVGAGETGTVKVTTDCPPTNDSGTLIIQVRPSVAARVCESYDLEVYVH